MNDKASRPWKCGTCGFVYDEETEGVPFEDLPENWVCPICGMDKGVFEPLDQRLGSD